MTHCINIHTYIQYIEKRKRDLIRYFDWHTAPLLYLSQVQDNYIWQTNSRAEASNPRPIANSKLKLPLFTSFQIRGESLCGPVSLSLGPLGRERGCTSAASKSTLVQDLKKINKFSHFPAKSLVPRPASTRKAGAFIMKTRILINSSSLLSFRAGTRQKSPECAPICPKSPECAQIGQSGRNSQEGEKITSECV